MKSKLFHKTLLSLFLLMLLGCGQKDSTFQADYKAALESKSGQELFNTLIQLDQKYPDRLEVKVDLGAFLLAAGDTYKARIYLESAEKLAGRNGDAKLKVLLFTNLAELSYRDKKYPDAVRYADSALALNPTEPLGVVFTRAKAYYVQGKNKEALSDFDTGWGNARSTMIPDDFRAYSALLVESSQPEKALEVLGEYQYRFVYETGTGLTESVLLEKLGKVEESILSAFKELEYQRYFGALMDESASENLDSLGAKLKPGPAKTLAETLRRFVAGDWKAVVKNADILERLKEQPFAHYVMLAARMEEGAPSEETLALFLALEPHFRGLPGFYYHLWRGMKGGSKGYSKDTALPVLEKCILLAPRTRFARESRREIGALLGLSAADGEKLLLGAELDDIALRVVSEADLSVLEPVFSLLSIPDNAYEMAGILLIKRLVELESVRELVRGREKNAAGKLKERLTFVLSG
jgi:hypothetical protein